MAEQKVAEDVKEEGEEAPKGIDWGYVETPEKHKDLELRNMS